MLWGSISKVYGEDFKPFLGGVFKGLSACIEQEEADLEVELGDAAKDLVGQEVTIGGRKVKVAETSDDEDGDIEDIDLDDEDDWEDFTTVTPLALEKEIAVEVIGDLISHTKGAYLPYFEKTIELVLPLTEHPYEGVRKSTISTLHRAYATLFALAEENGQMPKWQAGLPLKVQLPLEVQKFAEILMTATIKLWGEESDPYVYLFLWFLFLLFYTRLAQGRSYMMTTPLPSSLRHAISMIDANNVFQRNLICYIIYVITRIKTS